MTVVAMKLLDRLIASIRAAMPAPDGAVPPAAMLWTDADGQWRPLVPSLRAVFPWLYTLGAYDPQAKTGPAIWLKCIVDGTVAEAPPRGEIPVLYLPNVRRQELRAAGDCPPHLQPLVELQYRGRVWHQPNGHDWTVRAFLGSGEGMGLEIAADRRTEEAMMRALPLIADMELSAMQGRRLDSDDFDKLAVDDPVRDLLLWLNHRETFEAAAKGARWESLRSVCQSEFGLDPDRTSPSDVAGMLVNAQPRLERVWIRFKEAPQLYTGVAKLLREPSGATQGQFTFDGSRDPKINERDEAELRGELAALVHKPHVAACARLLELEQRHAERRGWVWARLNWSPWANAMAPLARLARSAQSAVGGSTVMAAASAYAESGWECDRAAMEALALFGAGSDSSLMAQVVRALYQPWLDASARHFQSLIAADKSVARELTRVAGAADTCLMFVDGFRFDLAGRLAALLEERSMKASVSWRLAALPTVTPTAKPAALPVQDGIRGTDGTDFTPVVDTKGGPRPLTAPLLRERLEAAGIEVLESDELRIPSSGSRGAWTECGSIDSRGHSLKADLVHHLSPELERIAARVAALLDTGWQRVKIVTDHGWLLLPGGLPKVELQPWLSETKWARCAVVKGQPDLTVPVAAWHWNPEVRIAFPHGIACFRKGEEYAHGGISPQECVTPILEIERGFGAPHATIQSIEWRGMRCRVRVQGNDPLMKVDLRTSWKQAATSIAASAKGVGANGEVSLAVPDDDLEGTAASVVLLDRDGNVIASQTTRVGEKS
ncbi:MAG: BREX-1 system phosphatase PglZ type B [Acidobacteriota bacterium]|nr:BREX-1 system phosphatase PglZ type B [Acidobacteriota bacterium]